MRFMFLALLVLGACDACVGKEATPKAGYGSAQCSELKCDSAGVCECVK